MGLSVRVFVFYVGVCIYVCMYVCMYVLGTRLYVCKEVCVYDCMMLRKYVCMGWCNDAKPSTDFVYSIMTVKLNSNPAVAEDECPWVEKGGWGKGG